MFPQPVQQQDQNHVSYKIAVDVCTRRRPCCLLLHFFTNFGSKAASASLGPSLYTGIVPVSLNLLPSVCFCHTSSTHSGMSLVFFKTNKVKYLLGTLLSEGNIFKIKTQKEYPDSMYEYSGLKWLAVLETEVLCGLIKYLWVCKGTAKGDLIFDENLWIFTPFFFSFSSYFLLQPVVYWIVGGAFYTHFSGVANSHKHSLIKGIAGLYCLNSFGLTRVSLKGGGKKKHNLKGFQSHSTGSSYRCGTGQDQGRCYSQAPDDWLQVREAITVLLWLLSALRRRGLACAFLDPLIWFWSLYSLLKHFWLQNLLWVEHEGKI